MPGRLAALSLAFAVCAGAAGAAVVTSDHVDSASVTIYRDGFATAASLSKAEDDDPGGLALVVETRTVDLPAGPVEIRFQGVSDAILPQSVVLAGLPGPPAERNYDFDLLTPDRLIQKSQGQSVTVTRLNRRSGARKQERAVIRAGAQDAVVLDFGDHVEALGCGGELEGLIFDRTPPGLSARPTLSVRADIATAGRQTIVLGYLTQRMNWAADYVARLDPDRRRMSLTGWITLSNRTGAAFAHAPVEVVAGKVSRVEEDDAPPQAAVGDEEVDKPGCWPGQTTHSAWLRAAPARAPIPPPKMVAVPLAVPPTSMARSQAQEIVVTAMKRAVESQLGDYKLYTLAEPTDLNARQTKQAAFLDQPEVKVTPIYQRRLTGYDPWSRLIPAEAILRLNNRKEAGLGRALPAGTVRILGRSARGQNLVIGEARVNRDTPVGEPLELNLGPAPAVLTLSRLVSENVDRQLGTAARRIEVTARNVSQRPVTLEIRQDALGPDFKVTDETRRHTLKSGDPLWSIDMPARSSVTLGYSLAWRWK